MLLEILCDEFTTKGRDALESSTVCTIRYFAISLIVARVFNPRFSVLNDGSQ